MQGMSRAARWTLIASVIAGVSYVASWSLGLSPEIKATWKGAGVVLLAVHAALRAKSLDGWLLTLVMALGAGGDVLLEVSGLRLGAVSFLFGHMVATVLYLSHRKPGSVVPLALIPIVVGIAYLLPHDRGGAGAIALYALFLAVMAATALISRFPLKGRPGRVDVRGLRPVDLRPHGAAAGQFRVGLGVWSLYYFGQMLICVGVAKALEPRTA
jgi:uncharacterized membrane protein YhhN